MCKESATADDVRAAMPHPVAGSAADPIALEPVDDVVVTTLVDNVYDALLTSDDSISRAHAMKSADRVVGDHRGVVHAGQFEAVEQQPDSKVADPSAPAASGQWCASGGRPIVMQRWRSSSAARTSRHRS